MRCECYEVWYDENGDKHEKGRTRHGWYWLEGTIIVYSRVAADCLIKVNTKTEIDEPRKVQGIDGRLEWRFAFMHQSNKGHREGNWMSDLRKELLAIMKESDFVIEVDRNDFFPEKCPRVSRGQQ